nr:MAG TPA: hypothetical protein [Caudoviricetes sp.]
MEEVKSFTSMGSGAWKTFNTLLGAAGTAMGATALGSKTSEDKVREIIREENGMHGHCNSVCSENTPVSRYEMEQSQRIALLESDKYTDQKILDAYKQSVADNKALKAEIDALSAKNSADHETIYKELVAQREAQLTSNAKFDKDIALNAQAAYFQNQLNECRFYQTKKVVAKSDICPGVMPEYNSWTAPTTTPATGG